MSPGPRTCRIVINGRVTEAVPGASVAAVLWDAGWRAFSSHPVTGRPQGPLCGMGVCQECRVWVSTPLGPDGRRPVLVRSCLEPVRDGLQVEFEPPGEAGA
jgi:hypothetical protein